MGTFCYGAAASTGAESLLSEEYSHNSDDWKISGKKESFDAAAGF